MKAKFDRLGIYKELGAMGIPSAVLDELSDKGLQKLHDAIKRAMEEYRGN